MAFIVREMKNGVSHLVIRSRIVAVSHMARSYVCSRRVGLVDRGACASASAFRNNLFIRVLPMRSMMGSHDARVLGLGWVTF